MIIIIMTPKSIGIIILLVKLSYDCMRSYELYVL